MLNLLPALETAFEGNATLTTAFPGNSSTDRGFRLFEVPEGMAFPFVRATPISSPREQVYSAAGIATSQIQYDVIASTNAAARTAMATFIGVWDTIALTLSGAAEVTSRRLTDPMPLPSGGRDDDADEDVFAWMVVYEHTHT
jgi:hypothetical protein